MVRLPQPIDGEEKAVLKRVAVPDKEALASMRTEVETMKKLKGHQHIVRYMDSHASALKDGGFEVFLLMEHCNGGGLIDFMNTRLQNRLTEPEILKIFSDTCHGVASMHYLKPPLLHRDLKVENILVKNSGSSKQFKLCDFGSSAQPRPAATNAAEGRLIEEDVQKHTTMQYRSPEMIDVYRRQPIDEKSDIWALGVLLYKLCYYTTPFEEQGQMAILNARFKYPAYPQFSDRLKQLIAMMLMEQPTKRPNIYQVFKEVCSMRNRDCPLKDIYSGRTASEARKNQALPTVPSEATVGISHVAPVKKELTIPDIAPMRRGRPTSQGAAASNNPSPSPGPPISSDPFAALDGRQGAQAQTQAIDELSSKFPSLDQFSLLHDSGSKFAFEPKSPPVQQQQFKQPSPERAPQQPPRPQPAPKPQQQPLSERVTAALADNAFAQPKPAVPPVQAKPPTMPATTGRSNNATQTIVPMQTTEIPARPKMVSTGTMTTPSPPANDIASRPIWKVPRETRSHSRSGTDSGTSVEPQASASSYIGRPGLADHRSKSQTAMAQVVQGTLHSPAGSPRLQAVDAADGVNRSRSATHRSRPISASFEHAANFLRGRSPSAPKKSSDSRPDRTSGVLIDTSDSVDQEPQIESNVEFLRQMEEDEAAKRKEKRLSGTFSLQSKRQSMPASTSKSILSGRFGDAFKKFESSGSSAQDEIGVEQSGNDRLTPIPGSETIDGRSDDGQVLEETEEVSPEVRRELERRRLSQEERRVAEAAAQYKQRIATSGTGSKAPSKASAIQNRVQALLDESNPKSPTKTAEGYGRFTNEAAPRDAEPKQIPSTYQLPQRQQSLQQSRPVPLHQGLVRPSTTAAPERGGFARPSAPPKPQVLRTGGSPAVAPKPAKLMGAGTGQSLLQQRLMQDAANSQGGQEGKASVAGPTAAAPDEDWETSFCKKYPSLGNLEMEEMKI